MPAVDVVRDRTPAPSLPIDESVRVPDSVKRAAALAESFYQKPVEPVAVVTPPVGDPPLEPVTPQPSLEPEPLRVAPAPAAEGEWENRYKAMKGRHDKGQEIIASMQEQMSALSNEVMALQRVQQQVPPPQAPQRLISPQEEQDYGSEFLGVVRKAAQEQISPELAEVKQEVQNLRQQQWKNAERAMWGTLNTMVPEWRTINRSPDFKNWLMLPDPMSGVIRKQLLNRAYSAADAPRVARFFTSFVSEEAVQGSDPQLTAQPQLETPARASVSLEAIAAPGRARSAPSIQDTAGKPVFTRAQITKFYDDVRRGIWAGREVEKARYEQTIFAAQGEGRIRG